MTTNITKPRVLLSVGVIVAVAAATMGATYAAWTASGGISGNTVSTATVSLTASGIANSTSVPAPVIESNVVPGYVGDAKSEEYRTLITNNGTVPLKVWMYVNASSSANCVSTKIAYQSSLPNSTTIYYGYYPYSVLTSPEVSYFKFINDLEGVGDKVPVVDSLAPGASVAVRTVPAFATDADQSLQGTTCEWSQVYYGETI